MHVLATTSSYYKYFISYEKIRVRASDKKKKKKKKEKEEEEQSVQLQSDVCEFSR
jgi:hypothetical protein